MKDREADLFLEIAKLLKKYGPETFAELAKTLSRPDFLETLVGVLDGTRRIVHPTPTKHYTQGSKAKLSPESNLRAFLKELQEKEPEKVDLLMKFYNSLLAKHVLPTLRDVQSFLSDQGIQQSKAKDRSKAIPNLIRTMSKLECDRIKQIIASTPVTRVTNDRSLEGWSGLILDRERRMPDEDKGANQE
jgi:hypothetical protein